MPRPAINRRRQNSFNRFSPKRRAGQPDANVHRDYLQKKLASVPVGNKPENSDDSDGIVTTQTIGRSRRRVEIYASGAVAKGDKPGAFPTKAQRTRTLRGDTEEIVSQRSRSQSRAASAASPRSTPTVATRGREDERAEDTTSSKRRKITKADGTVNGASQNAPRESSVLGAIKPRKRQNSILETIGIGNDNLGLDSSAIHSDDEDRFLPDEVSTPARDTKNGDQHEALKSTSSLKRKRGATEKTTETAARSSSSLSSVPSGSRSVALPQPELPRPSRTQQRKLSTTKLMTRPDDDIMAPPESSDSEGSAHEPEVATVQSPKVKRQKPIALSTQQLQNLMPSKREKPLSASRPQDEFDIQEDSTSTSENQVDEEQEPSRFSPVKTRRGQTRIAAQAKGRGRNKGKEKSTKPATNVGKAKVKTKNGTKSTKHTSSTPSPTRLRTPLPLSSSKPRRTEAKSPSKQDTIMRDKSANTPLLARTTRGIKQRYGGSHHKGAGKENQPIPLFDASSSNDTTSLDKEKIKAARKQANGPEIKAWKKKWADIDDFKLDFEEVSVSTRSSSPIGRAR